MKEACSSETRRELTKISWRSRHPRDDKEYIKKLDEQGFKLLDEIIVPEHREFRDFIESLVNIDPKKRPTAREALRHKFLSDDIPLEYEKIKVSRDSKSTKPSSSLHRTSSVK